MKFKKRPALEEANRICAVAVVRLTSYLATEATDIDGDPIIVEQAPILAAKLIDRIALYPPLDLPILATVVKRDHPTIE